MRHVVRKSREWLQGGRQQKSGYRDDANKARRKCMVNGDSADKAWWQCTGDRDDTNEETALPRAAGGAERGGGKWEARGRRWGPEEIPHGTARPAVMLEAEKRGES